jgi:hypothetical protein
MQKELRLDLGAVNAKRAEVELGSCECKKS